MKKYSSPPPRPHASIGFALPVLVLGCIAFGLSAWIEFKAIVQLLPAEITDAEFYGLSGLVLMIGVFEGMKACLLLYERQQQMQEEPASRGIRNLASLFKLGLFLLSAWCTLALCAAHLTDRALNIREAAAREQLEIDYKSQIEDIEHEWNPQIQSWQEKRDHEYNRRYPNGDFKGPAFESADKQYKEALAQKEKRLAEARAQHHNELRAVRSNLLKQSQHHNPLMEAFRKALQEVNVPASYEQCVYAFSLLLSLLLEAAIYLAFSMAAVALIPFKND